MSDEENPIIDCTIKELCAFAFGEKRRLHPGLDSSYASFDDWWIDATAAPFACIKDAAWKAWAAAGHMNQPNHGDLNHFNGWWKANILDRQPATT